MKYITEINKNTENWGKPFLAYCMNNLKKRPQSQVKFHLKFQKIIKKHSCGCDCEKGVLRNFAEFTGKHLHQRTSPVAASDYKLQNHK